MEQEEEVVYLKIFDEKRGDVIFEGKVSTDVAPDELVYLKCFRDGYLDGIYNNATNERVKSFKGLQNNVELIVRRGGYGSFTGVLYVAADDGVVRKSKSVPSCECKMMSVCRLSHEECEKAFRYETLEVLDMYSCQLSKIPTEVVKMKELTKLALWGLRELKSVPEEIGELSNLEDLQIGVCGIQSLPKRLRDAKLLKSISLMFLPKLQLNAEDLVVCSKLKHLRIISCSNVFTPSFAQSFWEMIKSTTDVCVLELHWNDHNHELFFAALEENGSIVDGGKGSESYANIFERNKANHERAMEGVVQLLAIKRWRNVLSNIPKEMIGMLAMMLWNTKCDVGAWTRRSKE